MKLSVKFCVNQEQRTTVERHARGGDLVLGAQGLGLAAAREQHQALHARARAPRAANAPTVSAAPGSARSG